MKNMHISQITLRDWKAYATARFNFPAPSSEGNIILIGAPNGYGKTSLFEAIVLGMFGRDGLPLIARSPFSDAGKEQVTSYRRFLEKSLHRGAITAGRTSCSVKLTFIDDDDQPLEIIRIWHFKDSGDYRPQDDEIHIYEGLTRKPMGPGSLQGNDRANWTSEYIAKTLLPYTLAHVFLFDGEQVGVLAEREKSAQVRHGIEGLLGIPILTKLAKDLRNYSGIRRREYTNVSNKTMEKLERENQTLSQNCEKRRARLSEIEPKRNIRKREQDQLIRELSSYGAGSQALLKEQLEKKIHWERVIESKKEQLELLMMNDFALALSGLELRKSTKERLLSEGVRERWESGKSQSDNNLERFIQSIDSGMNAINPALSVEQREAVLESARRAWEKLWHPPPANCAEEYLHFFLNERERLQAIECLDTLDELSAPAIANLLDEIAAHESELYRLNDEITRTENIAPHLDNKRIKVKKISDEIGEYEQEIGALSREIASLQGQINQKNAELTKLSGQFDQAIPSARRVNRANRVAQMVDKIVAKAVPSQIKAIADAMTNAHRSMAHKKDLVERIAIDENCDVKLLNSEGTDLRDHDLSAGEKQIFTQALLFAVSSVSGRGFPMVIDTPLGRLDVEHRKGVLNHLAQRDHQVILLSTNTEVVGKYLHEIEPRVQKKYLVHFEHVGEIGQSTVRQGYFEETEVRQ